MGTKKNPGQWDCYANAEPDEPMFVLLARDPRAAFLVGMWVALSNDGEEEKNMEALKCAQEMDAWFLANRGSREDKMKLREHVKEMGLIMAQLAQEVERILEKFPGNSEAQK